MGVNFPSSPSEGQVLNIVGAPTYIYRSGVWIKKDGTAQPYNRIINPAMQVSQERGSATSPLANGGFVCDQWAADYVGFSGIQSSRAAAQTVNGSATCASFYFGTANPSPAAGDYFMVTQAIEGNRVADLLYGSASAKQLVLKFWLSIRIAGTYTVVVRNAGVSRSWIGSFVVGTGSDLIDWIPRTLVIPGDVTGTWAADNSAGLRVSLVFACGTTFQGAAGWQAGNKLGMAGHGNIGSVANWNLSIGDVGLYADPNLTGVAPEFQMPLYEDDLRDCMRYWYRAYGLRGINSSTTTGNRLAAPHPVPMRATPALAMGAVRLYDGSAAPTTTSIATVATDPQHVEMNGIASGLTAGRTGGFLVDGTENSYIACSARM